VFLRILHSLGLPARGSEEDVAIRTRLGLGDSVENSSFVASWLGKLILFSTSQAGEKRCPGLTVAEFGFLNLYDKGETWRPNASGGMNLTETKILAAKFLASGAFLESERFLPALCASADSNSRISEIGNDILKRSVSSISLEDPDLLEQLFRIYLGTRGTEGSLPARAPLQIKILGLLSRSVLSSTFVEQGIQIIREGLVSMESSTGTGDFVPLKIGLETSKLRVKVFAFTNWLARISPPSSIEAFAPTLVSQLRGYIESQGWPQLSTESSRPNVLEVEARVYCYESIGLLAAACPELLVLQPDLGLTRWLFTSLGADPSGKNVSFSIEHALSSILGAFGQELNTELEEPLTRLLSYHMTLSPGEEDESNHKVIRSTRFIALRFTNRCLPYRNVTARWIDILAMRDGMSDRSEINEEGRKGLDPYWYRMWNPLKDSLATTNESAVSHRYQFPDFQELTQRFFGPGAEWDVRKLEGTQNKSTSAYSSAVVFCRSILLHHALSSTEKAPKVNAEWERNIKALVSSDEESRAHIKAFLEQKLLHFTG
jgi:proteasome component ECM29